MGNKPRSRKSKQSGRKKAAPRPRRPEPAPAAKTPWLKYAAWGLGGVAVIVLLAFAFSGLAPTEAPSGIQEFPGLVSTHSDQPIAYEQDPPVGGPHAPIWMNCGFYATPIPNENAVHSLEHGVVWLTFDPSLPPEQVEIMRDFGQQSKVLVSPYPGLGDDVVATTWGRQLRIPTFDEDTIDAFVVTQKDGPGTPEPGALCSGGIGVPDA